MNASTRNTPVRHMTTGRFMSRAKAAQLVAKADKYATGICQDAESFPLACKKEGLREFFAARRVAAFYAAQLGI